MRQAREALDGRVGFVPTMGALHAGHLSLVEQAAFHVEHVAASVFVNPTQFNDPADFDKYPRTLDDDLAMLEKAGVELVFCPEPGEVYRPGEADVAVDVPALTGRLEGAHRPGHFAGVCRVVLKLFNIVRPDVAVFGSKDFQQLRVIEAMVRGLDLPIEIIAAPIVREDDGLAMSSRNRRLSETERSAVVAIPEALQDATADDRPLRLVEREVRAKLTRAWLRVDYVEAVDPVSLQSAQERPARLVVAAYAGEVRLIDNVRLG